MASELFDLAAKHLETRTDLDLLEARGTLRLALDKSGVEPRTLTLQELQTVFQKILPQELELRGIREVESVCETVINRVTRLADSIESTSGPTIDETFRRLGNS